MNRIDQDELLDSELKALPPPHAPATLLPRVLAAAARHSTVHPATGWFTWSWPLRLASVGSFAMLLAVAYLFGTDPPAAVETAARAAGDIATIVRVFRDVLFQPVAAYFFALGLLFALTCAAAWALMEVALGGASQQ